MLLDFLNKRKGGQAAEMSFMDHLEELRWHIARSILVIALFAVVLFWEKSFLFDTLILGPMRDSFPTYRLFCYLGKKLNIDMCISGIHFKLTSIDMTSQFMTHLSAAFTVGLVLAFPYVLWELWRFVSPALYEKERKSVSGVVLAGSGLFYAGLLFGYYLIAPCTVVFLGEYSVSDLVSNIYSLDSYMDTVSGLSLISGLVFEFPLVIYFLAKLTIISSSFLRKYRRYAIVICLFMAAVITPSPDMFTCTVVTIPIYGLYEVGILAAVRVEKNRKKKRKSSSAVRKFGLTNSIMKNIAIGCDHAGYEYKEAIKKMLQDEGYTVQDFGTNSLSSVDYPDYVHPACNAIEGGKADMGILLCGSANGVAITANKHQHIRAALCWTKEIAELARQHNNANVVCIPARFTAEEQAKQIASAFLNTAFEGGRHQKRVDKIPVAG